jgi:alpha-tubulin suppressor-like RCC1 family protein
MIVSCGSNAFNQLGNAEILEFISSTFKSIEMPSRNTSDVDFVESIYCGSNSTVAVVSSLSGKKVGYIWGNQIISKSSAAPIRVPTPIGKYPIDKISCGHYHAGFITNTGQVYTWGIGDDGRLGHGNSLTVKSPKPIVLFQNQRALSISCGGFHTGIIMQSEIEDNITELCMFGLGKAGQLGLGSSIAKLCTPTKVCISSENSVSIKQVSCGLHHTLILTQSKLNMQHDIRRRLSVDDITVNTVYACGYGEHGRLGLGDEENRLSPTPIDFPEGFRPEYVSAGEQHSLACGKSSHISSSRTNESPSTQSRSNDLGACYAWGSNELGQLGIGISSSADIFPLPMKVHLPEGMEISTIAAGGRHSAAITTCEKLLTWGWNEEGQLGHGSENNSFLPRPCRIPRINGQLGVPTSVSLGMSHTMVILSNPNFVQPIREPTPPQQSIPTQTEVFVVEPEAQPLISPEPEPIQEYEPTCELPLSNESEPLPEPPPLPEPDISLTRKPAILDDDDECSIVSSSLDPVRSVKELLTHRDTKRFNDFCVLFLRQNLNPFCRPIL